MSLSGDLKLQDLKAFYINDFLEFDLILYFRYAVLGGRRYLLQEKDDDLPKARRHFRRMKYLDYFVKGILIGFLLYYFFIKHNFLMISTSFCRLISSYNC